MSDSPTGPNRETLRHLHGMMPTFIDGMEMKTARGKGQKAAVKRAQQMCKVCCQGFDFTTCPEDIDVKPGICSNCETLLKGGYTAFVCGDRWCFAKSARLQDLAGTIQPVSPSVMDKLATEYRINWKTDSEDEKPDSTSTV